MQPSPKKQRGALSQKEHGLINGLEYSLHAQLNWIVVTTMTSSVVQCAASVCSLCRSSGVAFHKPCRFGENNTSDMGIWYCPYSLGLHVIILDYCLIYIGGGILIWIFETLTTLTLEMMGWSTSMAVARPSSILDPRLVWGSCGHFLQHKRCDQPVKLALYAIGCLSSLPCRHCVKPANSAPGGEASLVIGSCKNVSKLERKVLLFSRPSCRADSKRRQNGRAAPSTDQQQHNSTEWFSELLSGVTVKSLSWRFS